MSELHETMAATDSGGQTVRVAVEGCGHGTLHAIYASVEESCKAKGWDGVDVLIIGGDFQAVRNKLDLNVTAMPAKYRRMADFHEYYSGSRVAPYLTIFVGGNHEASNYLFELYYGGWVAPNIYYMGAANVLRFGPLRIAALSGIWKGYDYNKPHYERLPYNNDDIQSIYHVREIDVRKLLSIRTQVDIGMSHDWPQGIEWAGNHQWLFKKKDLLYADAMSGKLGSVAAKQCLDRLRPKYWFSAHLHIKYPARVEHGEYLPVRHIAPRVAQGGSRRLDPASDAANPGDNPAVPADDSNARNGSMLRNETDLDNQGNLPSRRPEHTAQLSAWQNFHLNAAAEDAAALHQFQNEQAARVDQAGTGLTDTVPYHIEEIWKQVKVDENLNRDITSVSKSSNAPTGSKQQTGVDNLDGCMESKELSGDLNEVERHPILRPINHYGSVQPKAAQGSPQIAQTSANSGPVHNDDEIDVNMDDSSSEAEAGPRKSPAGGVNGLESTAVRDTERAEQSKLQAESNDTVTTMEVPEGSTLQTAPSAEPEITPEMRAELAALSNNFKPAEPVKVSPSLPLPEAIANKVTDFLALDKCEPNRDFLQLLEITPISTEQSTQIDRPFKLEYDPEWLAIQRVFASDLKVGGDPKSSVAPNLGDTHYRERILEEEKWITEHVVAAGKLFVPENFCQTAPVFDPHSQHQESEMPREHPSPQTEEYCRLLGIKNNFAISEEDIDQRIANGPRPERERFGQNRGRGGGHHGRGRGGFGGRGGGGRGGRGRGRGGNRRW